MDSFRHIDACRICDNTELVPVLSLGEQCLTGVFPRAVDAPLTSGPLELVKCSGSDCCGLLQLRHSYNPAEMYGANYGYRSSLNQSMVDHLQAKVEALQRFAAPGDGELVLDIGSNDGTTLGFYSPSLHRVGMDPTASMFRGFYSPGIDIVADFFSARLFDTTFGGKKAKIVTSIAMLYDLDNPLEFSRDVASILAADGIWHFEQSYMPLMLSTNGYDTICHEHVEYYSYRQIAWLMQRSGLRILDVQLNDVNGGSFAVTVCREDSRLKPNAESIGRVVQEEGRKFDTLDAFEEFAVRVRDHRAALPEFLHHLKRGNSVVLGYGASTKGNVMLQYCGIGTELLPCIAEVNSAKFGAFTPGTNIPIVSEDEARSMNPDFFLAMPWHFRKNLLARERSFIESGGQMIFPLPTIEIVGRPTG